MNWLDRFRRKPPARPAVTHDWTRRPYEFISRDDGQTGGIVFWSDDGRVPHEGDYLILRNGDATTRYRVVKTKTALAEGDVWSADVAYAPRDPTVVP